MMEMKPSKTKTGAAFAMFLSGHYIVRTIFGKKICRKMNGQDIVYYVQRVHNDEIIGHMFDPIRVREDLLTRISKANYRAPWACRIFFISFLIVFGM